MTSRAIQLHGANGVSDRYPVERRKRSMFGLPTRGPSPVRLLVESQGLALEQLRGAVLEELDRDR